MSATRHGEGLQSLHPDAGEAWFLELPPDRQAELTREWQMRSAVWEQLSQAGRRRLAIEMAQTACAFAVADLICPLRSFVTFILFALCGALNGFIGNRADLGQVRTSALGLASFFVLQLVTRNGLSVMQMLVCFPLGCVCAYLGWRRSDRAFD